MPKKSRREREREKCCDHFYPMIGPIGPQGPPGELYPIFISGRILGSSEIPLYATFKENILYPENSFSIIGGTSIKVYNSGYYEFIFNLPVYTQIDNTLTADIYINKNVYGVGEIFVITNPNTYLVTISLVRILKLNIGDELSVLIQNSDNLSATGSGSFSLKRIADLKYF